MEPTFIVHLDRAPAPRDKYTNVAQVWCELLEHRDYRPQLQRDKLDGNVVDEPFERGGNHGCAFGGFELLAVKDVEDRRWEVAEREMSRCTNCVDRVLTS